MPRGETGEKMMETTNVEREICEFCSRIGCPLKHEGFVHPAQGDFDHPENCPVKKLRETCEVCRGSGRIDCSLDYEDFDHPEDCPACGGSGEALCPYCTVV